jgi:hypothetical protein
MKITEEAIVDIEHRLIRAIKSSDIVFLDACLHDDLLFIAPRQVVNKSMDLASHRAGQMVVDELIPTFEEIKIIGDTASVIVVYETKGTMMGNPIQGKFRYLRIWQSFGGALKVIGGSCMKIE